MELRVSMGRGYVSADKNFDEDMGIGYIPIDSVHSPVRRCNYHVEAARIGQATDYDRLVVDIRVQTLTRTGRWCGSNC